MDPTDRDFARRARRPFRVDRVLKPEDRPEYEALLTDPRATGEQAHAWLAAHGYALSRGAVYRHRRHVLRGLDGVRRWAAAARHLAAAARDAGPGGTLADGTLTVLEQLLLRALHAMSEAGDPPDPKQLADLATAVCKAVASREALDEHRHAWDERARAAAETGRGATGREVVARVREILGMPPLPPELYPEEEGKGGGDRSSELGVRNPEARSQEPESRGDNSKVKSRKSPRHSSNRKPKSGITVNAEP